MSLKHGNDMPLKDVVINALLVAIGFLSISAAVLLSDAGVDKYNLLFVGIAGFSFGVALYRIVAYFVNLSSP